MLRISLHEAPINPCSFPSILMSSTSAFLTGPTPDAMNSTALVGEWTRHPDLYFPDGTIILVVQSVVFRVYHGLLSTRSEVFDDMIAIGSTTATHSEVYDGCPVVVHLHGDSPTEFAYFLRAVLGL